MREILFRGKGIDSNKWVAGTAIQHDGCRCTILYQHPIDGTLEGEEVDPETVGQYTYMADKNGRRIFEGDIVRYSGENHEVVFENRFENAYFGIVMEEEGETRAFGSSVPSSEMEVVGNVYDNRERRMTEDGRVDQRQ